jgi:ABC-type lipoprotein export system ATPase subunit
MKKIKSIEIQNSDFYITPLKIDFSEKLNCIMGGRGTGKSTLLHFIKSCLEMDAEEDRTTNSVLKGNLGGGLIKLLFETSNGETYRIEKTFGEEPQPYLESTNRHIALENIWKEFVCDFFPAQMIEEIGRNPDARLELIDRMLINEKSETYQKIEDYQIELEKNAREIRAQNQKLRKVGEILKEYSNIELELENHKQDQPKDIEEKENAEFEKQDNAEKIRGAEKRYLKNILSKLNQHFDSLKELNSELLGTRNLTITTDKFINKKIFEKLNKDLIETSTSILNNISTNSLLFEKLILNVNTSNDLLKIEHEKQHNEFVQLKQKLEKHKEFYDKLNLLTKKLDEKKVKQLELKDITENRTQLKKVRNKGIKELNKLKLEIYEKRLEKINKLNSLFEGRVKITLTPNGINREFEDTLRSNLKGHGMRYNTIIPYIVDNFTPDTFAKIIHDSDAEKLKDITSIDIERSEAIIEALYETDGIYQIETIYCPDLPDFHLKVDKEDDTAIKGKENYKKSDELSTGQRCTAVLPIVFAISNNPLIIDQPEDNLDNKYISDTIHKIIKEQKLCRQLLFITHNANIPVLSDSEKNIFLRYEDKKSRIADEGDVEEVKDSILNLLEGGKEAFDTRMNLYNH